MQKWENEYSILIQALSYSTHEYHFEGGSEFFTHFPQDAIQKGTFEAEIHLQKQSSAIFLDFSIRANVTLICDRTLEPFDFRVISSPKIIFKFGEETKEINDTVSQITYDTASINVANYIFEYIFLSLPMRKLHPKFAKEKEETKDDSFIYVTEQEEQTIDPRWAALQKIKK